MLELATHQRDIIKKYLQGFLRFLESERAKKWHSEREERSALVRDKLSENQIDNLTEADFRNIFINLYATQIWTNKDHAFKNVMSNGIDNIRHEIKNLLFGKDSLASRYDLFKSNIKHMGPATITEILVLFDPSKYCIWNMKPRYVLPSLNIRGDIPERTFNYGTLNGETYEKCFEVLDAIRKEIKISDSKDPDFWDADFFIAYIFEELRELENSSKIKERKELNHEEKGAFIEPTKTDLDHTSAELILLKVGRMLGYETYTADPSQMSGSERLGNIATLKEIEPFIPPQSFDSAKRIDVLWLKDDAPAVCFEVEHSTGVTSGLQRLYQIRQLPTKFFIIAPADVRNKFETEIRKAPFKQIASRYIFKSYEDLQKFFDALRTYKKLESDFIGN